MKKNEDFQKAIDFTKSCSNPTYITGSDGHPMPVPCGKCKYCQLKKSYSNKKLCDIESNIHTYTYFVTLTYDPSNVPFISLRQSHVTNSIDKNTYSIYPCSRILERYDNNYLDFSLPYSIDMSQHEFEDIIYRVSINNTEQKNRINVLFYYDLQIFLKRLRKNVTKFSSSPIRYYAVGEYGPEHYRPHWHIILYFDDPQISENIVSVVSQSWKLGFTNTSKSRGKVSNYLTSYVNSNAIIPDLFKIKQIRPHSVHSKFFGLSILKPYEKEITENGLKFFDTTDFNISNKVVKIYPTKNIRNYYFPKVSGFNELSSADKVDLYALYLYTNKIKSLYGYKNLHEIFTFYVNVIQSDPTYYLNLHKDSATNFIRSLSIIYDMAEEYLRDVDEDYLFNKFLSVYYTSKRFCTLYNVNYSNIYKKVKKIETFYSDFELSLLNKFYEQLETYSSLCETDNEINSVLLFYNNGVNYLHGKVTKPLEEIARIQIDEDFQNTIKHKKLNDKLNIFSLSY